MFQECIVCGTRTHECVTLLRTLESVPLCSDRCRRLFLSYPWQFLETETEEFSSTDSAR